MFGWRKRNDGFEWRTYVRTTVLARRAHRKQKVVEAGEFAVEGLKEAGRRGVDAGRAGAQAARIGAQSARQHSLSWMKRAGANLVEAAAAGYHASVAGLGVAGRGGAHVLGAAVRGGTRAVGAASSGLADRWPQGVLPAALDALPPLKVLRDDEAIQLAIVATGLALASLLRLAGHGLDALAVITGSTALMLAAAAALGSPRLPLGTTLGALSRPLSFPPIPFLTRGRLAAVGAFLALVVAGALLWEFVPQRNPANTPVPSDVASLSGRASAAGADLVRLDGQTLRIDGVEAPSDGQMCVGPTGRRSDCAQLATQALSRLVRGKNVRCTITGRDPSDRPIARCAAGDEDVGEHLVRGGYVFTAGGLFAGYGGAEADAKAAKSGFWKGSPQRPDDYRASLWESAKQKAPEGCPIKGQATAGGGVYLLPWARSYERTRVRAAKGDRWFCSEDEAKAAGWKPSERL